MNGIKGEGSSPFGVGVYFYLYAHHAAMAQRAVLRVKGKYCHA